MFVLHSRSHLHRNSSISWAILNAVVKRVLKMKLWDRGEKSGSNARLRMQETERWLQPEGWGRDSLLCSYSSVATSDPQPGLDEGLNHTVIWSATGRKLHPKVFLRLPTIRIFTSFSDFSTFPSRADHPSHGLAEGNKDLLLMGTTSRSYRSWWGPQGWSDSAD